MGIAAVVGGTTLSVARRVRAGWSAAIAALTCAALLTAALVAQVLDAATMI
jgi:hypothetical protein